MNLIEYEIPVSIVRVAFHIVVIQPKKDYGSIFLRSTLNSNVAFSNARIRIHIYPYILNSHTATPFLIYTRYNVMLVVLAALLCSATSYAMLYYSIIRHGMAYYALYSTTAYTYIFYVEKHTIMYINAR